MAAVAPTVAAPVAAAVAAPVAAPVTAPGAAGAVVAPVTAAGAVVAPVTAAGAVVDSVPRPPGGPSAAAAPVPGALDAATIESYKEKVMRDLPDVRRWFADMEDKLPALSIEKKIAYLKQCHKCCITALARIDAICKSSFVTPADKRFFKLLIPYFSSVRNGIDVTAPEMEDFEKELSKPDPLGVLTTDMNDQKQVEELFKRGDDLKESLLEKATIKNQYGLLKAKFPFPFQCSVEGYWAKQAKAVREALIKSTLGPVLERIPVEVLWLELDNATSGFINSRVTDYTYDDRFKPRHNPAIARMLLKK